MNANNPKDISGLKFVAQVAQPAVSPTASRLPDERPSDAPSEIGAQVGDLRNSRLAVCATSLRARARKCVQVSRGRWRKSPAGFTLIELLVVIAIIAILASLLLAAIGKAKQKAQGITCMSNLKQLSLAWLMYAHDSNDRIPYAVSGNFAGPDPQRDPFTWVTGTMNFNTSNPSNWDIEQDIKKSPLWPYCNAPGIWKCPADKSSIVPASGPLRGRSVLRVRSTVMLIWLGGFGGSLNDPELGNGLNSPPWRLYRGLNDLVDPGPTKTLLFWDQREDSINWGAFGIDMTGYPDSPQLVRFNQDMPASYHNRAGGLSFTDGHSETKRWQDSRTVPPVRKGVNWIAFANGTGVIPSPYNKDILWLQERATRRIK